MNIQDSIKEVLNKEAEAISKVSDHINESFEEAINIIYNSNGKLIITGVGKSGHVGEKMAATFASTGTPSFFVHSTEALHGDLGMIQKDDVVLAISNSGETQEVLSIIPTLKLIGCKIISLTNNRNSTLGKVSNIALEINVESEADQLNLAPTSSSTVALVVGDAIAVTISEMKGFNRRDFAFYHPGGSLGKQLLAELGSKI